MQVQVLQTIQATLTSIPHWWQCWRHCRSFPSFDITSSFFLASSGDVNTREFPSWDRQYRRHCRQCGPSVISSSGKVKTREFPSWDRQFRRLCRQCGPSVISSSGDVKTRKFPSWDRQYRPALPPVCSQLYAGATLTGGNVDGTAGPRRESLGFWRHQMVRERRRWWRQNLGKSDSAVGIAASVAWVLSLYQGLGLLKLACIHVAVQEA